MTETPLSAAEKCLILASDGVWEFISSQEALDICFKHQHSATAACQALIKQATYKWSAEEGNYRDDITAIVVFLPVLADLQKGTSCDTCTSSSLGTVCEVTKAAVAEAAAGSAIAPKQIAGTPGDDVEVSEDAAMLDEDSAAIREMSLREKTFTQRRLSVDELGVDLE